MFRLLVDFNEIHNDRVAGLQLYSEGPRRLRAGDRVLVHDGAGEEALGRVESVDDGLIEVLVDWATFGAASTGAEYRTLSVGEALVGEGNEVAHVDALVGSKTGPVGTAFASALVKQRDGHTNLLAIVAPNLPAKPDTIIANKVTIRREKQVGQIFGPAQAAVARAVVHSVRDGVIPESEVEDLCIIVGVFIHWEAADDKKIYNWNYQATKAAIARAMANEPPVSAVQEAEARDPFAAGTEA
jgi:5,6,7,8-tetrahydromethanopterin hydro-lyase